MTDEPISNLPVASAFNDDDEVAIVQSGATKKATRQVIRDGLVSTATESTEGILEIASTAEAEALALDNKIITPLKLDEAMAGGNVDRVRVGAATAASVPATGDVNAKRFLVDGEELRSDFQLLSTQNPISVASVDFTDITGYDAYYVVLHNVRPATDGTILQVLYSTNNGSTYAAPSHVFRQFYTEVTETKQSTVPERITSSVDNTASEGFNGVGTLIGLSDNTVDKTMHWAGGNFDSSGGSMITVNTLQLQRTATIIDAIRFSFLSGNVASGIISIYGIRSN